MTYTYIANWLIGYSELNLSIIYLPSCLFYYLATWLLLSEPASFKILNLTLSVTFSYFYFII